GWSVRLYPVEDTLGNRDSNFRTHSTKLTVTNTPAPAVPAAPTGVAASRGDGSAQVSWAAADANGSPVTGYTVTTSPGGGSKTVGAGTTSTTVTGLDNGTVVATNAVGDSPASEESNEVTPAGVPDQVAKPSATPGDKSASISWSEVAGNGSAISGYTVTTTPGGASRTVGADTTSTTVTGLDNGTAYTFTVVATNAVGDSPASEKSNEVTPKAPATVPDRVDKPSAKVKKRKAVIRWSPTVSNGSDLISYTVKSNRGVSKTTAPGKTKAVFRNLRPGRYKFHVIATNAVGDSRSSSKVRVRIR
uniref:fibronectin type III domain-containing protein n=1 Tax=Nocardioides salarius TaxID=374513 RepID=UPI0030F78A29